MPTPPDLRPSSTVLAARKGHTSSALHSLGAATGGAILAPLAAHSLIGDLVQLGRQQETHFGANHCNKSQLMSIISLVSAAEVFDR